MANENHISWILEELGNQFATVVSTMTGGTAATAPSSVPAPEAGDSETGRITWIQPFDLGEGTVVVLAAPPETWRPIGVKPLEAAGLPPEDIDDESARSTFLEILSQTMGALGTAAGARAERQVLPQSGQQTDVWPEGYAAVSFQLTLGSDAPIVFYAAAAPGWETAFQPPAAAGAAAGAAGGDVTRSDASQGDGEGSALVQHSRTFDLLLDVELPVSISFGRAMVPLRDVVKLTSGSVVELNRTVSEPVEVIVNNCVIARGEVVVIEGNYGVRIQQIISPRERLRTLH